MGSPKNAFKIFQPKLPLSIGHSHYACVRYAIKIRIAFLLRNINNTNNSFNLKLFYYFRRFFHIYKIKLFNTKSCTFNIINKQYTKHLFAQNDMGSPKNAFKIFRPKLPLSIGHSHYACARYAIKIRIAFLLRNINNTNNSFNLKLFYYFRRFFHIYKIKLFNTKSCTFNIINKQYTKHLFAQNDMGSPKNAFKIFRPKLPLSIGHSHYACARYAIKIRIAFLLRNINNTNNSFNLKLFYYFRRFFHIYKIKLFNTKSCTFNIINKQYTKHLFAQNDMGSPKNAFKIFQPKLPLSIGHSHYACARYAIEIRIAFLLRNINNTNNSFNLKLFYYIRRFFHIYKIKLFNTKSCTFNIINKQYTKHLLQSHTIFYNLSF